MRREFGSRLFQLTDRPINDELRIELLAASAEALARWEPRLSVDRVLSAANEQGQISLTIEGEYLPTGERVILEGVDV